MQLPTNSECNSCSHSGKGLCATLCLAHMAEAGAAIRTRTFKPRTLILRRGEKLDAVAILCSGLAIEYIQLVDGRRQILSLAPPGTALAWDKTTEISILAITEARVALVPLNRIAEYVARAPAKFIDIVQALEARRYEVCELTADIGRRTALERVCRFLLRMLHVTQATIGDNSAIMRIPLKREEIADILGLTTTHVTRVLTGLRADDLVSIRGDVYTLRNIAKLTEATA